MCKRKLIWCPVLLLVGTAIGFGVRSSMSGMTIVRVQDAVICLVVEDAPGSSGTVWARAADAGFAQFRKGDAGEFVRRPLASAGPPTTYLSGSTTWPSGIQEALFIYQRRDDSETRYVIVRALPNGALQVTYDPGK